MAAQMYLNVSVRDLNKSKEFFSQLGFKLRDKFTDEKAACLIINPDCYVMLLRPEFFQDFTDKPILDASSATEAFIGISAENRVAVDQMVDHAKRLGGSEFRKPHDHGFMYARSFHDLDGHIWEVFWMDESAMPTK
jgi:uncharacterized protein